MAQSSPRQATPVQHRNSCKIEVRVFGKSELRFVRLGFRLFMYSFPSKQDWSLHKNEVFSPGSRSQEAKHRHTTDIGERAAVTGSECQVEDWRFKGGSYDCQVAARIPFWFCCLQKKGNKHIAVNLSSSARLFDKKAFHRRPTRSLIGRH